MEWTQLKSIEAGWEPSPAAQSLLVERIWQGESAPRSFYFPVLKPILAVAAMAALLFGLLLLWPKKPIDEQIAILPGSSGEAQPDEYIEKDPSGEALPPKDESTGGNQTTDPQKDPVKEENLPATGVGEQSKMSFKEALATVREKASNSRFDQALTEDQREALSLYLAHENYYYLQGQVEGEIGRLKESGAESYLLEIQLFTTKDYLQRNLFENLPFGTLSERSTVLGPSEAEGNPYFYPRILGKELSAPKDYLKNLTLSSTLPDGRATATVALGVKPLTKAQCEKLINHFLKMENVTWVELQYRVEDETGDPTAIHPYWETQKEMPFEEAKAIVAEKVQKRPDQQLSDKERMAFYEILSCWVEKVYKIHSEKMALSYPQIDLNFCTTSEGEGMDFIQNFPLHSLDSNEEPISTYFRTKHIGAATVTHSFTLPAKESVDDPDFKLLLGKFTLGATIRFYGQDISAPSERQIKDWIRQLLSFECASGIQLDDGNVYYGDTHN